jgi:hypothetical protein
MRPLSNQVVLKSREDLEERFNPTPIRVNKETGLIEPRPVFGEVVAIGPGDQLHPDIPDIRKGDVVVWDLSKIGPPVIEHGQTVILVSFNALLGRLHKPGTPEEECQAILDLVLTVEDHDMMERQISSLIVTPQSVVRDGMKEAEGDCPISTVWERVVSVGKGITFQGRSLCARCKDHLQRTEVPDLRKHDLVCFNPAWAIDWRRGGRNYRFTPYSEIRGVAED